VVKNKNFVKFFCVAAICAGLTACGGGGGSDPVSQPTTSGTGSTTTTAEVTGVIQYTQYQASNTPMGDANFASTLANVSANATFNAATKQGSIQFAALNGNEVISTSDGYATSTWAGPFTSGAYRLNGNVLMGCNAAAQTDNQASYIYVSSSLTRLKDGMIDELNGKTFDLVDCGIVKNAAAQTVTINADGTMFLPTASYTFQKNEVFDLLNPEKYSGALVNTTDPKTKGSYAGHAFRFNSNGVSKYAIVIQTNANSFNDANRYHYMVAISR
jgi:hypothetical protein